MKPKVIHLLLLPLLLVASSCKQSIPGKSFDARAEGQNKDGDATFTDVKMHRSVNPAWLRPPTDAYKLGPGDLLDIEVADVKDTRARTFIMPDGMVYYNLAGGVKAEGLTLEDFNRSLTAALKRDYTNPQLNITVAEVRSRRYWMLGRVFKPGIFPLTQPTNLLEAIGQSGGLSTSGYSGTTEELADLSNSMVIRNGDVLPINFVKLVRDGDASQNIYLQHNDYIYIPSAQASSVLLLGAVRAPRSVSFKDSLTLVECVAQGNGPAPGGYTDKVVIVRGSLTQPRATTVNLTEIMKGKATDFQLKPGDIVWVPQRPLTLVESTIELVFRDAARTIAINEGARAVGSNQKTSISLPAGGN